MIHRLVPIWCVPTAPFCKPATHCIHPPLWRVLVSLQASGPLVLTCPAQPTRTPAASTPAYPGSGTGYLISLNQEPRNGYFQNTAVYRKPPATQTFKKGALLVYVSAGTLSECGADPSTVNAVALEPAGSKPGWDAANSPTVITGRVQEASVCIIDRTMIFTGRFVTAAGGDPTTPTQTLIDEQYGVAKDANGLWYVDGDETSAKVVEIVDYDADLKLVKFKFLEAVLGQP